MAEFRVPPLLLTGAGAAQAAGEALRERGYRRAFVVTDPGVRATAGARRVLERLSAAGLAVDVHDGITAEPTVRMVERALAQAQAFGADVVVGLGGGSPMDSAKGVAVLLRNAHPLPTYEGADRVPLPRAPLACIATTAGTGSEVTRYAVFTDEARNRKMLVSSWHLLPDVAVADPELSVSLPAKYTVSTGIDALTHAIEAYVSKRAQPLSESLALSAIGRIGRSLRRAYREPEDRAARAEMSLAALEAGIAFCNASVALVHGMARPLGAYFGVPHGLSNAVLLARVSAFTAPAAAERYGAIADALSGPAGEQARPDQGTADVPSGDPAERARAAVEAISRLCADLDVPPLRALGVPRERFDAVVEQMAADALASGSPNNNPRVATVEEIVALYRECY